MALEVKINKIPKGKLTQEVRYIIFPCKGVNVGCYLDETGLFYHCNTHWPPDTPKYQATTPSPELMAEARRLLGLSET
jgi:hypothetical protein